MKFGRPIGLQYAAQLSPVSSSIGHVLFSANGSMFLLLNQIIALIVTMTAKSESKVVSLL